MPFSLGILTWLEIIFYGLRSHLRFSCEVELGIMKFFSHIKCSCYTIYLHLYKEAINNIGHAFKEGKLLFPQCRLLFCMCFKIYDIASLCINYEIDLPDSHQMTYHLYFDDGEHVGIWYFLGLKFVYHLLGFHTLV